jgi:hypothetical protein
LEILIATALITALLVYALQRRSRRKALRPSLSPVLLWPGNGSFAVQLADDSVDQVTLMELAASGLPREVSALLIPLSDHPVDTRAVRVDIDGRTVGHLVGDAARNFRRRLQHKGIEGATTQCVARLAAASSKKGSSRILVKLDLKPLR